MIPLCEEFGMYCGNVILTVFHRGIGKPLYINGLVLIQMWLVNFLYHTSLREKTTKKKSPESNNITFAEKAKRPITTQ